MVFFRMLIRLGTQAKFMLEAPPPDLVAVDDSRDEAHGEITKSLTDEMELGGERDKAAHELQVAPSSALATDGGAA